MFYVLLISALAGGEWSTSNSGRFTPGEIAPDTHWIGGRVSLRTGFEDEKRRKCLQLPGFEPPTPWPSSP
jgi:hypothetical protein